MIETSNSVLNRRETWGEQIPKGRLGLLRSRGWLGRPFAWLLLALSSLALPDGLAEADPSRETLAALRPLRKPNAPNPSIGERYRPIQNETIVLLGGTNVVEQQFANYFEALVTLSWPDAQVRFRNLAWEADTVYRQQRPLYFFDREESDQRAGSTPDQRKRIDAGTVFVRFGKMESLDGYAKIDRFLSDYGEFLDALLEITPRVIVVTPTPFFLSGPASGLARKRNEVLEVYTHAMRVTAVERSLRVVDLFREIPANEDLSENGVHLNNEGHRRVALAMLQSLDGTLSIDRLDSPEFGRLRDQIAYKNSIWLQYFRPTNWSFLYGNRQHVPSSRDHLDNEKRWFPFEIESALTLIHREEREIRELAREWGEGK